MACTARGERELKMKAAEQAKNATNPLEKLRALCLSRGANGIKGLGRAFRIMDDDGSKSLCIGEFTKGITDYGMMMTKQECDQLFTELDKTGDGTLDFDEFLVALRPPMSKCRKNLIHKAFVKLDKTGDGKVTVDDLKGVYNVKQHPKFINGEKSEDDVLREFLDRFDTPDQADGVVTREEFLNYYCGVSASIDRDAYFTLMMTNAWKLQILKSEFLNYYSGVSASIDNDAYFDLLMRTAYKLDQQIKSSSNRMRAFSPHKLQNTDVYKNLSPEEWLSLSSIISADVSNSNPRISLHSNT